MKTLMCTLGWGALQGAWMAVACLLPGVGVAGAATTDSLDLIPWPKSVEVRDGHLTIADDGRVVAGNESLLPLAKILAKEIHRATGVPVEAAP
jgi:hypothetical protein